MIKYTKKEKDKNQTVNDDDLQLQQKKDKLATAMTSKKRSASLISLASIKKDQ